MNPILYRSSHKKYTCTNTYIQALIITISLFILFLFILSSIQLLCTMMCDARTKLISIQASAEVDKYKERYNQSKDEAQYLQNNVTKLEVCINDSY